jgi:hypothetical protein
VRDDLDEDERLEEAHEDGEHAGRPHDECDLCWEELHPPRERGGGVTVAVYDTGGGFEGVGGEPWAWVRGLRWVADLLSSPDGVPRSRR